MVAIKDRLDQLKTRTQFFHTLVEKAQEFDIRIVKHIESDDGVVLRGLLYREKKLILICPWPKQGRKSLGYFCPGKTLVHELLHALYPEFEEEIIATLEEEVWSRLHFSRRRMLNAIAEGGGACFPKKKSHKKVA